MLSSRVAPAAALGAALALVAGTTPAAVGAPAQRGVRIRFAFVGHPRSLELPVVYDHDAPLVGQVLDGGRPLAGVAVQAYGSANGGPAVLLGTLTTNSHGIVAARVPVRARESFALVAGGRRSRVLSARATAAIALHASSRRIAPGGRIDFRGTTSPVVPAGLLVFLQVRRGRSWRVFKAVRTSRSGVFSGAYRFDEPGSRYAIRAEIPNQAGFGLTVSDSRPLLVTVR